MNTPNNKRKQATCERVEKAFIKMVQSNDINEIKVTDLIKEAGINRSTFYLNYLDVYDLADKIKDKLFGELVSLYEEEAITKTHSFDYLKLFRHVKDNQIYYRTLFKLGFDFSRYIDRESTEAEMIKHFGSLKNMDYHIEFHSAGMTAILRKWLDGGCKESPEEINDILIAEYGGRMNPEI